MLDTELDDLGPQTFGLHYSLEKQMRQEYMQGFGVHFNKSSMRYYIQVSISMNGKGTLHSSTMTELCAA